MFTTTARRRLGPAGQHWAAAAVALTRPDAGDDDHDNTGPAPGDKPRPG
ncbi:hypothetical protein [Streptomyces mutabilis]|nr:hypothetical protein [Streptomyces mutabilis]